MPLLNFTFHLAGGVKWQLQTHGPRVFCFHLTLTSSERLQRCRKKIFPLSMTSSSQEWRRRGGTAGDSRGTICSWLIVQTALLTLLLLRKQPNEWEAPCCRGPQKPRPLIDNYSCKLRPVTSAWFLWALNFTSHLQHSPLGLSAEEHTALCHVAHLWCSWSSCHATLFLQHIFHIISLSTAKHEMAVATHCTFVMWPTANWNRIFVYNLSFRKYFYPKLLTTKTLDLIHKELEISRGAEK